MANREHEPIKKNTVNDAKTPEQYLKEKAMSGIGKTVESILNDESVKRLVEKTVVRQSIETGVFLSFLLMGMLTLANVAKALSGLTWQGDLVIGLTLISIGGVYMVRKLFQK